jgi:hypothetical protein
VSPRARSTERTPLPAGFWTLWTTVALDLVGFGIVVPILGQYAELYHRLAGQPRLATAYATG